MQKTWKDCIYNYTFDKYLRFSKYILMAYNMEKNLCNSLCPVRTALSILWGRWTLLILYTLGEEPKRYGELKKLIPDITEKMLIEKLKELQSSGFVTRKDFKTIPPKVVYTITDLWKTSLQMMPVLVSVWEELIEKNLTK